MRIMSLDLGDKTIGVASSDSMGIIANGVETIRRKGIENDFKRLEELVNEYEVNKFVVGYPKNMNGSIGERAQKSEPHPVSWVAFKYFFYHDILTLCKRLMV